ncbi:RNase H domain-containing protein [Trichonephila clavipes]|nr:RNase H domain-containing protein [Trichonephila clavipes]
MATPGSSFTPTPLGPENNLELSDRHPFHLHWVPSHVGLLGNEFADDLAKAAASNPVDPETHMVLTSTEIYSRAKELICRTWVVHPVHPWDFQRHPGSAISFKGSRSYETAFSRFSTSRLRCMNFEGGKSSFPICPKCNISQSSPQHILQCLGFSYSDEDIIFSESDYEGSEGTVDAIINIKVNHDKYVAKAGP